MRTKTVAFFACLALATSVASGGPPLVCHPYVTADAPPPPPNPWLDPQGNLVDSFEDEVLRSLGDERETLLRADMVQRVLIKLGNEPGVGRFVQALERRMIEVKKAVHASPKDESLKRAVAERRFDFALASVTAQFVGGSESASAPRLLEKAVKDLPGDPAAQLALARALTPLMRTGSHAEHARAFIAAYDLTRALPDGVAKQRLDRVLAWDLAHLEAYLLDKELEEAGVKPSEETRLEALRRHAAKGA